MKPFSGTLDFFVKTSEGIENARKPKAMLERDIRIRNPRAFYQTEQVIKNYEMVHANMLAVLPFLKYMQSPGEIVTLPTEAFINAFVLQEASDGSYWHVLVLFESFLVRIEKFKDQNELNLAKLHNEKLRNQGNSLLQITSCNSAQDLTSVDFIEQELQIQLRYDYGNELVEVSNARIGANVVRGVQELI